MLLTNKVNIFWGHNAQVNEETYEENGFQVDLNQLPFDEGQQVSIEMDMMDHLTPDNLAKEMDHEMIRHGFVTESEQDLTLAQLLACYKFIKRNNPDEIKNILVTY